MNKVDIQDDAPKRLKAAAETFGKVRAGLNAQILDRTTHLRVNRRFFQAARRPTKVDLSGQSLALGLDDSHRRCLSFGGRNAFVAAPWQ